jgi:hypothetical protein
MFLSLFTMKTEAAGFSETLITTRKILHRVACYLPLLYLQDEQAILDAMNPPECHLFVQQIAPLYLSLSIEFNIRKEQVWKI